VTIRAGGNRDLDGVRPMDPAQTRTIELTMRNELAEMAQLRDTVDRCAAELAMPAKALFQLQVALDELVSNVIRYAWPSGGSHQFLVRVTLGPCAAKVEVIDDGVSFDPRRSAPQAPSEGKLSIGGRGITMLRTLVDGIDYARIDNRNHTTLHKHW
jgi:anti-sigma regulatory factor (Ser/Thr protein kinase)